jgi:hypothetical protein
MDGAAISVAAMHELRTPLADALIAPAWQHMRIQGV